MFRRYAMVTAYQQREALRVAAVYLAAAIGERLQGASDSVVSRTINTQSRFQIRMDGVKLLKEWLLR